MAGNERFKKRAYMQGDLFALPELPQSNPPSHESAYSKGAISVNSIVINPRQHGNPVIEHIRHVPWEYGETSADYVVGKKTAILFLSIKYHRLHPDYIHRRIAQLGQHYELKVLLVRVDVVRCYPLFPPGLNPW
jgi:DNA excision repair protein ERCC-1